MIFSFSSFVFSFCLCVLTPRRYDEWGVREVDRGGISAMTEGGL